MSGGVAYERSGAVAKITMDDEKAWRTRVR